MTSHESDANRAGADVVRGHPRVIHRLRPGVVTMGEVLCNLCGGRAYGDGHRTRLNDDGQELYCQEYDTWIGGD